MYFQIFNQRKLIWFCEIKYFLYFNNEFYARVNKLILTSDKMFSNSNTNKSLIILKAEILFNIF
jgi:hypothetical protein